jgi:hypothetical protein
MSAEDWIPMMEAPPVRKGTLAELKMESGRVYRATWRYHGRICAWWPEPGQQRKSPIGLFDPAAIRVLAVGHSFDDGTAEGMAREKARASSPWGPR